MCDDIEPAVYIVANHYRGTIYIGVTGALWDRVQTHKDGSVKGFTADYGLKNLVWYEHHDDMTAAIKREKQLKAWKRDWKIELVESINRDWLDLAEDTVHRPFVRKKLGPKSRGIGPRVWDDVEGKQ